MNKDYAEKEQMEDKIVDIKEKNEDEKQHHHKKDKWDKLADIGRNAEKKGKKALKILGIGAGVVGLGVLGLMVANGVSKKKRKNVDSYENPYEAKFDDGATFVDLDEQQTENETAEGTETTENNQV